jgi:hypothetical protein
MDTCICMYQVVICAFGLCRFHKMCIQAVVQVSLICVLVCEKIAVPV